MTAFLYRLGRSSFRRRKLTAAVWSLLIVGVVTSAVLFSAPQSTSFSVPGTESQRARDALDREFPAAIGASGAVALRAPDGLTFKDSAVRADVARIAAAAEKLPGVVGVQLPYNADRVSRDGRIAILGVQYAKQNSDLKQTERDAYIGLEDVKTTTDLEIAPGGDPTTGPAAVGATEGIGVAIALVVLIVTLGSLLAAGMTLFNALIGVAIGLMGLTALSGVVELNSTAPILALMLGLAVGIDYSLFITARYRTLRMDGVQPDEAAGIAVATAGSAVVFAGLTVVIALAALSVVGIPFIGVMGLAAAGTVAIAVAVSLSLLPALLGFAARRVMPRRARRADANAVVVGPTLGRRWVTWVIRHRGAVLVCGLLGLLFLALPVTDLRLALSDDGSAAPDTTQRKAYDLVSEGFGAGYNSRLILVVSGETRDATTALAERATAAVDQLDDVVAIAPAGTSDSGTTATLLVLPKGGPASESTQDLVHDVRDTVGDLSGRGESIDLTGLTAISVDVSERLAGGFPIYLVIVVGLSLVLLMVAFRSVLVPVKATIGFLLSLGATFGVTVAVFQWGWLSDLIGFGSNGAIDSVLPILLVGILFGLAMDYEVFLVSRMREEFTVGRDAHTATIRGVEHGARVVTAAALIMTSVFAGFVLIEDPTLKTIGFALALGVFIDAFVVRMTLVPAVMSLLGARAWAIPGWLNRLIPAIDIGGHGSPRASDPVAPTT